MAELTPEERRMIDAYIATYGVTICPARAAENAQFDSILGKRSLQIDAPGKRSKPKLGTFYVNLNKCQPLIAKDYRPKRLKTIIKDGQLV